MADKFRKTKSNFATTLVTGIGTGTGDTITLNSTTGLPTDTEITLTFNRVTSGGVVNSTSVMERITGTISGATLTSYTRGVDGTTEQAHAGGTVVEYIPNAADMNDQVDGILVGHNQDGTHKSGSVLTLPQINDTSSDHQYVVAVNELTADRTVTLPLLTGNDEFVFKDHAQTLTNKTLTSPVINTQITGTAIATGTEVASGTDNTKVVTPKAIGDAGVNTRLKSKSYTVTRDMTAASGDVSYTTIGFTPTAIYCLASVSGGVANSNGFCDSSLQEYCTLVAADGKSYLLPDTILKVESSGGNAQSALVKSFDADGFTLTWTKINSATGTLTLQFLCFR